MSSEENGGNSGGMDAAPQQQSGQGFTGSYIKEKPVKVGQELDVTISEISRRGDGVARIQGFVIFVPGGRQGQQVKIRVTGIKPNFATAEMVESGPASTA